MSRKVMTIEEKRAAIERIKTDPSPVTDARSAACILNCSERTIMRMCERGDLKAHKVMSLWRINKAQLLAIVGME